MTYRQRNGRQVDIRDDIGDPTYKNVDFRLGRLTGIARIRIDLPKLGKWLARKK